MNSSGVQEICPECGAAVPEGELTGLCPRCAWRCLNADARDTPAPARQSDGVLFTVAGHEVLAEIARGGGGIVYRARQHEPRREVALKILPPHQLASVEMRARFRGEAETIAALDHPAILPVHAVGEHEGSPYFTMKLATGGTLASRHESLRGDWRAIATLVAELADAVHYAHVRGVIHRDLKPGNVLFDDAGRAFVSDFGLAKFTAVDRGLTQPASVLGTPAYLAPEVAEHGAATATSAADIYSLGAILYELLTGRPPFEADSLTALLKQIATQPPPRPRALAAAVPRDLEVICLRCLAKEPAGRFLTAGLLAEDLRRWLADRPILSRPVSPLERLAQWSRRNPALAGLSAALLLAVVAGGAALGRSNSHLRTALDDTRSAESAAQEQLHRALLAEARNQRVSGRFGQRFDALASLARAATIRPDRTVSGELASALALPDFRLVQRFDQPSTGVRTPVAFGPDAATFARGVAEGGVGIFRTRDGAMVRHLPLASGVVPTGIVFSEDGSLVAVTHRRGALIWKSGAEDPWLELPHAVFALHPTAENVAFVAPDRAVIVRTVDGAGDRVRVEAPPSGTARALSFSADGLRLAIVGEHAISVTDTTSGAELWQAEAELLPVAPAWSADGARLAVAHDERHEIALLDARTGGLQRPLVGHTGDPARLLFSPDGRRLFSNGYDLSLRLWDVTSGQELLRAVMPVSGFRLSRDGRRLGAAVDAETPALFEAATEEVFRELTGTVYSEARTSVALLAVSPDGRWLATSIGFATPFRGVRVGLWDTTARREVASFAFVHDGDVNVAFASDTLAVVYGCVNTGAFRRSLEPRDGTLVVGAEERLGSLLPPPSASPEARWNVIAVEGPALEIVAHDDGPRGATRRLPLEREVTFAISPDSQWLVAGNDWGLRTWRLDDLAPGPTWPALRDGDRFRFLGFSPDGRWLVTEISQGSLDLRDGRTFAPIIRLDPPVDHALTRMVWAPDGSAIYLMGVGPRVFCWDLVALRRELAERGLNW